MVLFHAEKGQNSSTKMVPFHKRVKIPQQKWYYFTKGSKILNKNGTISEKGQKSSTKKVPFQKRVKNRQQKTVPFQKRVENRRQKWYHFRKWSKFLNKNSTISGRKGSKFLKEWQHFRKWSKFFNKMVPFQKRVKIPQQKWYHFSQKRVIIPRQKRYHFRKGSKFLNKNGTISENAN